MGLSALQSISQDKAIMMRARQFFTSSRFLDFLSWVFSSTAHISNGEYVRTTTSDCQFRPQTNLNVTVFRVSFHPLDDLLPPKPTQPCYRLRALMRLALQRVETQNEIESSSQMIPSSRVVWYWKEVIFWITSPKSSTSEVCSFARVSLLCQTINPS
jgi:hypothetical protein